MCVNCEEEYGTVEPTPEIERVAELVRVVYEQVSSVGGDGHVVFDDYNLEDRFIEECLKNSTDERTSQALRSMLELKTLPERATALKLMREPLRADPSRYHMPPRPKPSEPRRWRSAVGTYDGSVTLTFEFFQCRVCGLRYRKANEHDTEACARRWEDTWNIVLQKLFRRL